MNPVQLGKRIAIIDHNLTTAATQIQVKLAVYMNLVSDLFEVVEVFIAEQKENK